MVQLSTAMRILVVHEDKPDPQLLGERLIREGYDVVEARDGSSARAVLAREVPNLLLLDIRLPDTDGIRILRGIHEQIPDLPVIILTTSTSVGQAVEAMKLGAVDYITKPFNMDDFAITVKRALEAAQLRRVVSLHVSEQKARYEVKNLVGQSRAIEEVRGA